jgi:predicted nucleic-acid-binding Zn-ribbon protein
MQESNIQPCSKCGGNCFAVIINAYSSLGVEQPKRDPGFIGGKNRSRLKSVACGTCGYIELYAEEPEKIVPDTTD